MSTLLLFHWLALMVPPALATFPAQDPCLGVPGGCPPENTLKDIVPVIAPILISVVAGGAMLFTVIGGAQMLLSFGDESRGTKGRTTILYALGGFIIAVTSQSLLSFVLRYAGGVVGSANPLIAAMRETVSAMVSLFNITFLAMVIYAAFRLLLAKGKTEEYTKAINTIIWAVIGAIVINVSYAIVTAVANIFIL